MKNYIKLILMIVPIMVIGQSADQNYVKKTVYTGDHINDNKIEIVTYFDGLGRPIQSVSQRAGGNKEDIITVIEYDAFGRQTKEYLPYSVSTNSNGYYIPSALTDVIPFYANNGDF